MKLIFFKINFLIKKINFKKIKKVDVLLLDKETNLSDQDLKISRLFTYINISYILRSLLRYFLNNISISDSFFVEYIHQASPKFCISSEISERSFKSKKYFKNITSITYQLATYWPMYADIVRKRYKGCKTDIFLLHSEVYKKYFNFLSKKFYVVGSLPNNELPKLKNTKKYKYDIMFISEFRKKNNSYLGTNKNLSEISFAMACSSYLINTLREYCDEKNKKLTVALVSNRKEKTIINKQEEIEFFKRDYSKIHFTNKKSLSLARESNVSVCLTSNLGPELISRKKKVLFLNVNHFFIDWEFFKNQPSEGLFWYKGTDKKVIFKKLDYLLNLNEKKWINQLSKFKKNLPYDYKNTKLLKIIKSNIINAKK